MLGCQGKGAAHGSLVVRLALGVARVLRAPCRGRRAQPSHQERAHPEARLAWVSAEDSRCCTDCCSWQACA